MILAVNYYLKFQEVLNKLLEDNPDVDTPIGTILDDTTLDDILQYYIASDLYITFTSDEKPFIKELLKRFWKVSLRYGIYFIITKKDITDWSYISSDVFQRVYDFFRTIYETKGNYIPMIQAQTNLIPKDKLGTITEMWHNDTPQSSGQYEGSNYVSDYNKSKTDTDLNPLDVIEQAKAKIDDYYNTWLKEFKIFMIYEV